MQDHKSKDLSIPLTNDCYSHRRFTSPYRQPSQYSLHQLSITYVDPTRVHELVELVQPRPTLPVLAAVAQPSTREVHWSIAKFRDMVCSLRKPGKTLDRS
jgi:hypothetical protein